MTERIERVESFFQQKELGLKLIPAAQQFRERLTELLEGRRVPVVSFNCLDFAWQQGNKGEYPKSIILGDTSLGNCVYYQPVMIDMVNQLRNLGEPEISIIVPDSELFDSRPFNFAQNLEERQDICQRVLTGLAENLADLTNQTSTRIITWSQYCAESGLPTSAVFTEEAYSRIGNDQTLIKKIKDQVKSSNLHFTRRRLDQKYVESITDEEMFERTKWYCAMYMGEGIALEQSKALVVNFEDLRVRAWYQRGTPNLPILTPVIPDEYYSWRNQRK